VDYLTIFREPNVEKILLALKPDVHAKGSDYTKATVPERATVLSYGGRIAIAGGPKIRSTSDVIPRILRKSHGRRHPDKARRQKVGRAMPDFLIIRLSSLGDIIHTIPAYAALRRAQPKARIRWVVERKGREILDFVPGIDEIIVRGSGAGGSACRRADQIALDFSGPAQVGVHRPPLGSQAPA